MSSAPSFVRRRSESLISRFSHHSRSRENIPGQSSRIRSNTGGTASSASSGSMKRIVPAGSDMCAKDVYSSGRLISPQNAASPYPNRP